VRLRHVLAIGLAALVVAGLSACSTSKAGAAAFVGDHRINEADVNTYVVPGFAVPTDTTQQQQQQTPPRVIALNSLIQVQLMTQLLDESLGGVPSETELAALHDEALATLFGIQQTGQDADAALRDAVTRSGLKESFVPVVVQQAELTMAVVKKINAQRQSDIANAVQKAGIPVTVNPRYGSWSTANAAISGPVQPNFLTLGPTETPTPQP
jgi:hypothetical protein